jgi:hypothetical protein
LFYFSPSFGGLNLSSHFALNLACLLLLILGGSYCYFWGGGTFFWRCALVEKRVLYKIEFSFIPSFGGLNLSSLFALFSMLAFANFGRILLYFWGGGTFFWRCALVEKRVLYKIEFSFIPMMLWKYIAPL